jgi:hypothetical protein
MAKVQLDSLITQLRGSLGNVVVRHTPHGPVLSRRPDMSGVKWSPAQKAHRKRMKAAAAHYRATMADPAQAARYLKLAARQKIPVSSLVMGVYLKKPAAQP